MDWLVRDRPQEDAAVGRLKAERASRRACFFLVFQNGESLQARVSRFPEFRDRLGAIAPNRRGRCHVPGNQDRDTGGQDLSEHAAALPLTWQ